MDTNIFNRTKLVIGSRKSPLSLVQTNEVLAKLETMFPNHEFVLKSISTKADHHKQTPLCELARGAFAKEIEIELLDGEIDIAVHSAKDLPPILPKGIAIIATLPRQDPRDTLINRWGVSIENLPAKACIGTSSTRRSAQLLSIRSDLQISPIRGNIGTRIDKIHNNEYDGIILAAAGLIRIGQQNNIAQYLPIDKFTPDPGQGILAIQARETDTRTVEILSAIDHLPTTTALKAERAFMETLGANCKTPLASYARQQGDLLQILTMAILPDGTKFYTTNSTYDPNFPTVAGKQSACDLLATGASKIINLTNTIADNK
jgi:hydroxymethylbilane synthase